MAKSFNFDTMHSIRGKIFFNYYDEGTSKYYEIAIRIEAVGEGEGAMKKDSEFVL